MSIEKIIDSLPAMTDTNRDKLRSNAEHMRATGNEKQAANAETVLQALVDLAADEKQARYDALSAMSVSERVSDAFAGQPPSKNEAKVIVAIIDNPGETGPDLTKLCGWKTQSWQNYFSAMCKKREAVLWPDTETDPLTPAKLGQLLLEETDEGQTLTLKPDVEEAFRHLGFGAKRKRSSAA